MDIKVSYKYKHNLLTCWVQFSDITVHGNITASYNVVHKMPVPTTSTKSNRKV